MAYRLLVLTFPNKNAREYFVCAFFCTYARFFLCKHFHISKKAVLLQRFQSENRRNCDSIRSLVDYGHTTK
jgi:hypothetical protein